MRSAERTETVKTIVLDSQPIIAYFEKDAGWETLAKLLQSAADRKCQVLLSVVNWGEVYYITLREYGEEYADRVLHALKNMPIELVEANRELTLQAAKIKAKGGVSYADCFAIALARTRKAAELVTGDKEFKHVEREVTIRWI